MQIMKKLTLFTIAFFAFIISFPFIGRAMTLSDVVNDLDSYKNIGSVLGATTTSNTDINTYPLPPVPMPPKDGSGCMTNYMYNPMTGALCPKPTTSTGSDSGTTGGTINPQTFPPIGQNSNGSTSGDIHPIPPVPMPTPCAVSNAQSTTDITTKCIIPKLQLTPDQIKTIVDGLKALIANGQGDLIMKILRQGAMDQKIDELQTGDSNQNTQGNDDVKRLQTFLNVEGFNISTDGKFGPTTKRAVVELQKKNGLRQDGIVGPRFKMWMKKQLGTLPSSGDTTTNTTTPTP